MADRTTLLREATESFARELTETVQAVDPTCHEFTARYNPDSGRATIKQTPATGIELRIDDRSLLSLEASYQCCLDSSGQYMAVWASSFKVFAGGKAAGQPLFRYEYEREAHSKPAAHIHVHAHRDQIAAAMAMKSATYPKQGNRRSEPEFSTLSQLHFPVGGHRFRPCLEDVLETLITEFGIKNDKASMQKLRDGRLRWRKQQLAAAVRDDVKTAIEYLSSAGYEITPPDKAAQVKMNLSRLQDL